MKGKEREGEREGEREREREAGGRAYSAEGTQGSRASSCPNAMGTFSIAGLPLARSF